MIIMKHRTIMLNESFFISLSQFVYFYQGMQTEALHNYFYQRNTANTKYQVSIYILIQNRTYKYLETRKSFMFVTKQLQTISKEGNTLSPTDQRCSEKELFAKILRYFLENNNLRICFMSRYICNFFLLQIHDRGSCWKYSEN